MIQLEKWGSYKGFIHLKALSTRRQTVSPLPKLPAADGPILVDP